jgi:hypothetical protein
MTLSLRSIRLVAIALAVITAPACITYGEWDDESLCDVDVPPTARAGVFELQPEGTVVVTESVEVDPATEAGCDALCEALAPGFVQVWACDAIALDPGDPMAEEAGLTDVEAVQVNCSVAPAMVCF